MFVGHAVGHESTVGVPDEIDALRVNPILASDRVDETGEVGGVVDLVASKLQQALDAFQNRGFRSPADGVPSGATRMKP